MISICSVSCFHNIVISLHLIMVYCVAAYFILFYSTFFFFLEEISCIATLKISRINKVYVCMYAAFCMATFRMYLRVLL